MILNKCVCKYEPRGDNGLEGYQLNTEYEYEIVSNKYKVWIRSQFGDDFCITTKGIFHKYFKEAL